MIGEGIHASEENIAAQPTRQYALAFLQQDDAIRDGTRLGAPAA